MNTVPQINYISPEAYLIAENDHPNGIKYEYVNGQIYAMAGASRAHNIISGEMFALLRNHLKGSPCRAYLSDMKVGIQTADGHYFYYPDIQVSCQTENNRYFNTAPCLIIEVLSESTARIDRYEKLIAYKLIPSLQEYVLCSQETPLVEIYRRSKQWQVEHFLTGQAFTLESVGLTITVGEIYEFLTRPI